MSKNFSLPIKSFLGKKDAYVSGGLLFPPSQAQTPSPMNVENTDASGIYFPTFVSATGNTTTFNVDISGFVYDASNNRLGINKTSPAYNLDVSGTANITGNLSVDTNTLFVNASNNRVGVGTSNPAYPLDVVGDAKFTTIRDAENSVGTNGQVLVSNGSALVWNDNRVDVNNTPNSATYHYLTFCDNNTTSQRIQIDKDALTYQPSTNNLGIGTLTPAYNLDVSGTANISGNLSVDTNTLFVDASNNRVGIKTSSPSYELDNSGGTIKTKSINDNANSSGSTFQVLGNSSGNIAWSYPWNAFQTTNFIPPFPTYGSRGVNQNAIYVGPYSATNYKYFGGCVARNGKIYLVPTQGSWTGWTQNIGIFDPYTETIDISTLSVNNVPEISGNAYVGAVCADNGLVYCVPWNSTNIPIINPYTNTLHSVITGLSKTTNRYRGGVLAPNGKIYCAPGYNFGTSTFVANIGVIDTTNNTFSQIDISGIPTIGPAINSLGYYGGAIGKNGRIYFAPHTRSFSGGVGGKVLRIDPSDNAWAYIDMSGTAMERCFGANTLPDGNVMIMPFTGSTNFYKVDVSTETVIDLSGSPRPNTAIQTGVMGADGNLYCLNGYSTDLSLSIINTTTNKITTHGNCLVNPASGNANIQDIYLGAFLAPNGKVYFTPAKGAYITSIKTELPTLQNWVFGEHYNRGI